jgi:16S rRNA (adenine(1408)-N(1))-methyltransferase
MQVRGKKLVSSDGEELINLLASYEKVVVDVGTGDGRFAYNHAKSHPDVLVFGLDANRENLVKLSARALRRPERGGVPNVIFAAAVAERPP